MKYTQEIAKLFNVVVAPKSTTVFTNTAHLGFITDGHISDQQVELLEPLCEPLNITTLFTVEERKTASVRDLVSKQILHYIEVYGLGQPGLFNLEVTNGSVVTIRYFRAVTVDELSELVQKLLYTNAPVKDVESLVNIIREYRIAYDIDSVANNELRVALFDVNNDFFSNGDDAVRYICYKATGSTLLIKSKEVIQAVKNAEIPAKFFENHDIVLSRVFNRHKPLILACKNAKNRTVINLIGRYSKQFHVPVVEGINKRFIAAALFGQIDVEKTLKTIGIRDKFKYLNLLEYKKLQNDADVFIVRNGKMHLETGRFKFDIYEINQLIVKIIESLSDDLEHLRTQNILLDTNVDYGLPISRKQTLGRLPFGTAIKVGADQISSGIYWHENGGASDLDLSTIDTEGNRVGWGQISGYNDAVITFSGDVTSAHNGAMEFMTSPSKKALTYGLFVNIFRGDQNSEFELVVGSNANTSKRWIDKCVVREKAKLESSGNLIGFVKNGRFIVYSGRLNGGRISGGEKTKAIVARATSNFWTVQQVLALLDVDFDTERQEGVTYDHDLTYDQFSFDQLERLLLP